MCDLELKVDLNRCQLCRLIRWNLARVDLDLEDPSISPHEDDRDCEEDASEGASEL